MLIFVQKNKSEEQLFLCLFLHLLTSQWLPASFKFSWAILKTAIFAANSLKDQNQK